MFAPRPLTSRALKSLIDSLRPYLEEARVLDLYAGHGRFAIAALEEGASQAVLVENDPKTARTIQLPKKLIQKKENFVVQVCDVFKWLEQNIESFDVVFADPPFELWNEKFEQELMERIAKTASQACLLVIKFPKKYLPRETISGYISVKTSVFGDSKLVYYQRA